MTFTLQRVKREQGESYLSKGDEGKVFDLYWMLVSAQPYKTIGHWEFIQWGEVSKPQLLAMWQPLDSTLDPNSIATLNFTTTLAPTIMRIELAIQDIL